MRSFQPTVYVPIFQWVPLCHWRYLLRYRMLYLCLFSTGQYSDLKVKCQGKEWSLHTNVVCPQSKRLETLVKKLRPR
ncbi:hypothetical protein BJ878DRAFT_144247 [Calycina marina]|uniref:Uncharacterized protein n=1 Tax=Calycina marina TaxID=1763456 RepID=A0A9P7Z0Z9_9HELO|nr:hypothetical protein BJ878DRAFT_144247 [Calycina marina]